MVSREPARFAGRLTPWAGPETPFRRFVGTETGSATVLLVATLVALVWANMDAASYATVWRTELSVHVGGAAIAMDLRGWVNSRLLTFFFFFFIGLEPRRELDAGELRDRARVVLSLVAALGGMAGAVATYLAITAGRPSAHGWAWPCRPAPPSPSGCLRWSVGGPRTGCGVSSSPSTTSSRSSSSPRSNRGCRVGCVAGGGLRCSGRSWGRCGCVSATSAPSTSTPSPEWSVPPAPAQRCRQRPRCLDEGNPQLRRRLLPYAGPRRTGSVVAGSGASPQVDREENRPSAAPCCAPGAAWPGVRPP
jgi:hypothetical protein